MTTRRPDLDASALRTRITQKLLNDVNDVMYPSGTMLDRVEARLATPDDVAAYAETLIGKVEETKYPSTQMLDRLDGLVDRLEQLEQQQRRRQAENDRRDENGDSPE